MFVIKKEAAPIHIHSLFPFSKNRVPILVIRANEERMDSAQLARILGDQNGLMVNAGYQCAQPLYNSIGAKGGIRISLQLYNTPENIETLARALKEVSTFVT